MSYRKRKESVTSPSFATKEAGDNVSLNRLMVKGKEFFSLGELGNVGTIFLEGKKFHMMISKPSGWSFATAPARAGSLPTGLSSCSPAEWPSSS